MWSKWHVINVSYLGGLWDSMVQVSLHLDQYNANSDTSKMENVGDTPSKSNVRTIICFLHLEVVAGNDIHRWPCNVFKQGHIMLKHAIYHWIQQLNASRVTRKDVSRIHGQDSRYHVLKLLRGDHDWIQSTRQNSDFRHIFWYTDASPTGN